MTIPGAPKLRQEANGQFQAVRWGQGRNHPTVIAERRTIFAFGKDYTIHSAFSPCVFGGKMRALLVHLEPKPSTKPSRACPVLSPDHPAYPSQRPPSPLPLRHYQGILHLHPLPGRKRTSRKELLSEIQRVMHHAKATATCPSLTNSAAKSGMTSRSGQLANPPCIQPTPATWKPRIVTVHESRPCNVPR